jgi:hypothetical protein
VGARNRQFENPFLPGKGYPPKSKFITEVARLCVLMRLMSCRRGLNEYYAQRRGQGKTCHIVLFQQECHNVAINVNKKIIAKYLPYYFLPIAFLPELFHELIVRIKSIQK